MAGEDYLAWAAQHIRDFLEQARNALFIPYAGVMNSDEYFQKVTDALASTVNLSSIHKHTDPVEAIKQCDAILVGGGNTFKLVDQLYRHNVIDVIRERVNSSLPYVGWSAGSNVACPSLKTTNDMPIMEPPSFNTLNLVPFQINPHFTDQTIPNFGGETRSARIMEFIEVNPDIYVLGLREGNYIEVHGNEYRYVGHDDLEVFHSSFKHKTLKAGCSLNFLKDGSVSGLQ